MEMSHSLNKHYGNSNLCSKYSRYRFDIIGVVSSHLILNSEVFKFCLLEHACSSGPA